MLAESSAIETYQSVTTQSNEMNPFGSYLTKIRSWREEESYKDCGRRHLI